MSVLGLILPELQFKKDGAAVSSTEGPRFDSSRDRHTQKFYWKFKDQLGKAFSLYVQARGARNNRIVYGVGCPLSGPNRPLWASLGRNFGTSAAYKWWSSAHRVRPPMSPAAAPMSAKGHEPTSTASDRQGRSQQKLLKVIWSVTWRSGFLPQYRLNLGLGIGG
jgi:hypothetical protein